MVPNLESIKGGGGSIKVGTTGRISTLMSRELESTKSAPRTEVSSTSKSLTDSNLVPNDPITPRRLKPRTSMDEVSSSTSNKKNPELIRKSKHYHQRTHQVPMLEADNISLDRTPIRGKPDKRGSYNMVEVVDIKCGNPDRTWTGPITNRLKKLGFSKLSESAV